MIPINPFEDSSYSDHQFEILVDMFPENNVTYVY